MSAVVPDGSEVARRVAETDIAIQHELSALLERIAPLSAGSAEVAASFEVLRARWESDASRLHEALDEIAAAVGRRR